MDAFYASIEQRDNEEYRGKPLVVGYAGNRGVVAAASYEARKYGIYSAMSSKLALKKYPQLIFAPTRFDVYKKVSEQIRNIFFEYTDLVEPLSLDEAFLDVTLNHKDMLYAVDIAKEIKEKIWLETNLRASAGVSFNKFLAKIASDYNKPNGLYVIRPKKAERFIESLNIESFFGIGKKTAERMRQMGIFTGYDLKQKTEKELSDLFGKYGEVYYLNARGLDNREVNPNRIRKSVGAENTFMYDTDSLSALYKELEGVAKDVVKRIAKSSFKGRTVTLKIKFSDFKVISKSKTYLKPIESYPVLYKIALELLHEAEIVDKVRLIGLSVKNTDSYTEEKPKEGTQLKIPFSEFDDFF